METSISPVRMHTGLSFPPVLVWRDDVDAGKYAYAFAVSAVLALQIKEWEARPDGGPCHYVERSEGNPKVFALTGNGRLLGEYSSMDHAKKTAAAEVEKEILKLCK